MIANIKNLDFKVVFYLSLFLVPLETVATLSVISSIYGISVSNVFSIIFCILLFVFGGLFSYIAYVTDHSRNFRILSIFICVFMFLSGIFCILVDENFVKIKNDFVKGILYMFISSSIMSNFSFVISILVSGIKWRDINTRLLNSERITQIYFIVNFIFGLIVGGIFGFSDVEDMTGAGSFIGIVILLCFIGILTALGFVIYNEYMNEYNTGASLSPLVETNGIIHNYSSFK